MSKTTDQEWAQRTIHEALADLRRRVEVLEAECKPWLAQASRPASPQCGKQSEAFPTKAIASPADVDRALRRSRREYDILRDRISDAVQAGEWHRDRINPIDEALDVLLAAVISDVRDKPVEVMHTKPDKGPLDVIHQILPSLLNIYPSNPMGPDKHQISIVVPPELYRAANRVFDHVQGVRVYQTGSQAIFGVRTQVLVLLDDGDDMWFSEVRARLLAEALVLRFV